MITTVSDIEKAFSKYSLLRKRIVMASWHILRWGWCQGQWEKYLTCSWNKLRTFNTYLDIQQILDSPEKTIVLLSYKISWIFLPDFRILSYPRAGTPQALSDLPEDHASMGVPPHEEDISPMGYCRTSYRWRPKSQHTADMYVKIPWPKFSVEEKFKKRSQKRRSSTAACRSPAWHCRTRTLQTLPV